MNYKLLVSCFIGIIAAASIYFFQIKDNNQFTEAESTVEEFSGAGKSLDTWSLSRSYPSEKISSQKFTQGHQVKQRLTTNQSSTRTNWEPLGPQNFAGRILTLTIDPNQSSTLYAGAASGGLWKSIDDGAHWNYVSTGLPVLGVSSIVVNPNNSDEIFIGTGEVYGDFEPTDTIPNQGTGQGYTIRYRRGTYGIGILKSADGGLTWNYSLDWSQENELKGVNMIKMSPFNSNVLYAGTTDGLFQSTDGGSTWNNILELPNVMSITLNPFNEGTILLGVGNFGSTGRGVYRSEDGVNFSQITLPDFTGKVMLEFSPSNPNVAFASVGDYDKTVGLFRSEDAGLTWILANDFDYARYQGWYSHDVAISPQNDSKVLVSGIDLYRSVNNGVNLIKESNWALWNFSAFPIAGPEKPAGDFIHADIHDVLYHPTIPNKVYVASDGGVFKSTNDGIDFVSANTGLQTAQFYQNFSSSLQDENFAMGGLQDNATAIYRGNLAWERKIGGDGFGTIIDPNDDRNAWGSLYYMRIFYSQDKAQNFNSNTGILPGCGGVDPDCYSNFSAPLCFAPSSLNQRIYGASNIVYTIENGSTRTVTNSGVPLDGTNPVNCLAVSSSDEDLVYAGVAPLYSSPAKMFKSENGGDSWTEVTGNLPDRFPMDVKVDPCDDQKVYVVFGGYDLAAHLYRSEDGGETWNALGMNLPDVPTNAIFIDPENTDHIYVGNDLGVFVSTDGGDVWETVAAGLPDAVVVMSLSYTAATRKLRVATHGNGAYEADLLQEQENFVAQTDSLAEWVYTDFEADFADEPNACVFDYCFYSVSDFDGNDWRGNNERGFLKDDFEATNLHSEWTALTGDWTIQNGALRQANSNSQNTQLNINLNQTDNSTFLYQWRMNIGGNGLEKRAGIHIFADDLTQDFRGNSYLINFLEDADQIRIYRSDNSGNYDLLVSENVNISADEWLDCKVIYEPLFGRIITFLNDEKIAYVVDENPLTVGNGFSLRTGASTVLFDDLTIYQGRDCSGAENIAIGIDGDCRFESPTDSTFVCGIQSIGFSKMRGWTTPDESQFKIGERSYAVGGSVFTEEDEAMKNLTVKINDLSNSTGNSTGNSTETTDDFGQYETEVLSGATFSIRPEKLDSVKNGVNTFDMVLIRRHILGLGLLDSPYKIIAADVNKSGNITTIDLLKIRLLILDLEDEFEDNTSWRFVPEDFVFPNNFNGLNFPDSILVEQISGDINDENFVAIKSGDVNLSATLFTQNNPAETRSEKHVYLLLENKKLTTGTQVVVPFFAKDFKEISGYQMTLNFDKNALGFVATKPNELSDIPQEYFGTTHIEEGKVLMNWVAGKSVSLPDETPLFQLVFEVKKDGVLKNWLKVTDENLRSEAYAENDELIKINLKFLETEMPFETDNLQDVSFFPNPFSQKVSLNFISKKEETANIQFFDAVGKVLKEEKLTLLQGKNNFNFDFSSIHYLGVMFYKIKTKNGTVQGRLCSGGF